MRLAPIRGFLSKMTSERRKHRRLTPVKIAFAAVSPDSGRLGKIVNISRGGLLFEYLCYGGDAADVSLVDIFLPDNEFHLFGIPCCIVADGISRTSGIDCTNFSVVTCKRCSLCFKELTGAQQEQLNFFLENFTDRRE